jgi:hypothetical protein
VCVVFEAFFGLSGVVSFLLCGAYIYTAQYLKKKHKTAWPYFIGARNERAPYGASSLPPLAAPATGISSSFCSGTLPPLKPAGLYGGLILPSKASSPFPLVLIWLLLL